MSESEDDDVYMADLETEKPMDPGVQVQRKRFNDGSAIYRSQDGEEVCVYPPEPGDTYTIDFDDVYGDGKNAYTVATSEDFQECVDYIQEMVHDIHGPGEYGYFVYENTNGKQKLVYEYTSTADYDEDQHDESFNTESCDMTEEEEEEEDDEEEDGEDQEEEEEEEEDN